VLDVASQGPPGPPGPPGGTALQYPAGTALGGHRMVVLNDLGQAVYADSSNPAHASKVLGITTGASSQGDTATIQSGGELTESSWAWTLDQPVFLGTSGLLTQTQPATGFSLVVGFPLSTTTLFVNIGEPLIR